MYFVLYMECRVASRRRKEEGVSGFTYISSITETLKSRICAS